MFQSNMTSVNFNEEFDKAFLEAVPVMQYISGHHLNQKI